MNKSLIYPVFLLSVTLLFGGPAHAAPRVAASIVPIHSLVTGVMDGVAEPELIIPGHQSPHTFSLKPSQAASLAKTEIVFMVSDSLETFLESTVTKLAPNATLIELIAAPEIATLPARSHEEHNEHDDHDEHDHGPVDPHIWLDPINAKIMVTAISDTLSKHDPDHAKMYHSNATTMLARLDALDIRIRTQLKPSSETGVPYLVYHDAYQYFETRYDLHSPPPLSTHPELQVSAQQVHSLDSILKGNKLGCIITEPPYDGGIVKRMADSYHAELHILTPDGSLVPPGKDAYFVLLNTIAATFIKCMNRLHES